MLVDSRPRIARFNGAGTQLWVSSEVGGTVTVIDPKTRKIIGKINFEIPGILKEAIQPVGVQISKDDKLAFVALGPANRVAVIDTSTLKVLKYLLVGQRVWHMAFTPDYKLAAHHQRHLQRRLRHRRGELEGDQVDQSGTLSVGRCRCPV